MLTDTAIKNAKQTPPRKISDGGGLYLEITSTGSKLWRVAYRFNDKQKKHSIKGAYPHVSLLMARAERDKLKDLIARGIDPAAQKREDSIPPATTTFEALSKKWYEAKVIDAERGESNQKTATRRVKRLNKTLGKMDASKIEPRDVLRAISELQDQNKHSEAAYTRGIASQIFRYGIPHGFCIRDPAADISSAMTFKASKPRPALTDPAAFGGLLRDIESYRGKNHNVVGLGLKLLSLVATRPYKEFCLAKWPEVDFKKALWTIPKDRMKQGDGDHIVPLSRQAIAIFKKLKMITGDGDFIFSIGHVPIGNSTFANALLTLGYTSKQHVPHAFRRSFSTILNKEYRGINKVWHNDVIELQLAHHENSTRAIYNVTGPESLLPQRAKLMQHWADRCDIMRDGSNVVPIKPSQDAPVRIVPKRRKVA